MAVYSTVTRQAQWSCWALWGAYSCSTDLELTWIADCSALQHALGQEKNHIPASGACMPAYPSKGGQSSCRERMPTIVVEVGEGGGSLVGVGEGGGSLAVQYIFVQIRHQSPHGAVRIIISGCIFACKWTPTLISTGSDFRHIRIHVQTVCLTCERNLTLAGKLDIPVAMDPTVIWLNVWCIYLWSVVMPNGCFGTKAYMEWSHSVGGGSTDYTKCRPTACSM